jgi:hypothetical protein
MRVRAGADSAGKRVARRAASEVVIGSRARHRSLSVRSGHLASVKELLAGFKRLLGLGCVEDVVG